MAEYLDFLKQQRAQENTPGASGNLRAALITSADMTVEQTAQARQWAKELGYSEELVMAAPDRSREEIEAKTLEKNPQVANWAGQSPANAVYARANALALNKLFEEQARIKIEAQEEINDMPYLGKAAVVTAMGARDVGLTLAGAALAMQEKTLIDMEKGNYSDPMTFYQGGAADRTMMDETAKAIDWTQTPDYQNMKAHAAALRSGIERWQASDVPMPTSDSAVGQFFLDTLYGGPQLLGAAAIGAATGGIGTTAFMGGQIVGGQYMDLTQDGVDPDRALKAGMANAVMQAPLEWIPIKKFLNIFKTKGTATIVKNSFGTAASDVITEAAQGVPQLLTDKWAKNPDLSAGDILSGEGWTWDEMFESFGQGAYEGLTMAPYAFIGGGVQVVRARREEKRATAWADRQKHFYAQAQEHLPDKGGDPIAFESFLLNLGPEMQQPVFIPASGLEAAGQKVVGIDQALGLEVNNTDSDRVVHVPAARLFSRLNPEQFEALLPHLRRSEVADSLTEAGLKSKTTISQMAKSVEVENLAMDMVEAESNDKELRERVRRETAKIKGAATVQKDDKGEDAASAQMAEGAVTEDDLEADEPEALGGANVNARVLDSFLQSALPAYGEEGEAVRANLLDGLGISPEDWGEAVTSGKDFFTELDAAAPLLADNPLWDGVIDLFQTESTEDRAARDAALAELGAPPEPPTVRLAGADVSPKTKAWLSKELVAAGRSKEEAKRETQLLSRMLSVLARITGDDANDLARETFRFGRDDQGGAASFHQSNLTLDIKPGLDLEQRLPIVVAEEETAPVWQSMKAGRRGLIRAISGTLHNDATGLDIDLSAKNVSHLISSASSRGLGGPPHIAAVRNVKELMRVAALLKTYPDRKGQEDVKNIHRFVAPMRYGQSVYAVNMLVKEYSGERNIEMEGVYKLYDLKLDSKTPAGLAAMPAPYGDLHRDPQSGVSDISLENLLNSVKANLNFEQADRGRIEILDDNTINIIFTQSQDASTAVHEFAHAFRVMAEKMLAAPPDDPKADRAAYDDFVAGWGEVESWLARFDDEANLAQEYDKYQKSQFFAGREFGELSEDEKAAVTKRAKHEYFARGFEKYLMEGFAPTKRLQNIFVKMKELLTKLYEAVRLDVEINDDVRRFFDSVLATDEEILTEVLRAESSFSSEEWEELHKAFPKEAQQAAEAGALAREQAIKDITTKRIKEKAKALQKWRREAGAAAREDFRQMRLEEIIRRGGISMASLEASGLNDREGSNAKALRALRVGKNVLSVDGQLAIDELAEEYGFDSADDFFNDLVQTPSLKTLADEYVAEREAEFEEFFSLERGLSDAEINAYEEEHKLWSKYMGVKHQPGSYQNLRAKIKAQADAASIDELLRVNQAQWKQRLKDAVKKAREDGTTAGLMSGVAEGARQGRAEASREGRANTARARLEERINNRWALAELALKYQEQAIRAREIAKFEAKSKRIAKQKQAGSYRHGGILPNYHSHIKNILAAVGIGKPVPTDEALTDFVQALAADGIAVSVAPEIIDGSMFKKTLANGNSIRRTARSLNYEEFETLKNAIDNLVFLGRRAQQVRVDGVLRTENSAAKALIDEIMLKHDLTPPKSADEVQDERLATGTIAKARARWKNWRKHGTALMPSTLKWQHLAYELDGQNLNGVAQQTLYSPIDKAANAEIILRERFMGRLKEITEIHIGAKAYQEWAAERIYIKEYGKPFSRAQIIAAAFNYGNIQNATALNNHALFKGKGPDALFRHITDSEWNYVQAVWDFLDNEVYPELNALEKRTKGVTLKKVEANPFTVTLADGATKHLRGGYYPLSFDPEGGDVPIAENRERSEEIKSRPTLFNPQNIQASATITRSGKSYKNLYPLLDLGVLVNSLNDNINDLAYREAVADTWRILKRPDVKSAISGALGQDGWQQGKLWLYSLAGGGKQVGKLTGVGKWAGVLRRNVARAAMAAKLSVVFLQGTGAFQSAQLLGYHWTMKGFYNLYGNFSLDEVKARLDEIYEKSPQLKFRNAQSYDRDIVAAMSSGNNPLYKQGIERATEILFKPIAVTDQLIVAGVWVGAYQKALTAGKDEAHAIQDADATISLTQAMAINKDMSHAQQGWTIGEAGKLMTMFQTFFSSTRNLQWLALRKAGREARQDNYGQAIGTVGLAALNLLVLQSFFNALMLDPLLEDDEEMDEWAGRLALGTVTGSITSGFSGLPVIRDIMGALANEISGQYQPNFAISPIEGAINGAFRAPGIASRISSGKLDPLTGATQMTRAVGPILGIPGAAQIANTLEGIDEMDENEGFEKFYRLLIREPNK